MRRRNLKWLADALDSRELKWLAEALKKFIDALIRWEASAVVFLIVVIIAALLAVWIGVVYFRRRANLTGIEAEKLGPDGRWIPPTSEEVSRILNRK